MDRFIEQAQALRFAIVTYLKSSMDRFIVPEIYGTIERKDEFKIQYGQIYRV